MQNKEMRKYTISGRQTVLEKLANNHQFDRWVVFVTKERDQSSVDLIGRGECLVN